MAGQSNWEADKMLDVYIYDYLVKKKLHATAKSFMNEGKVAPDPVAIDAPGGFLFEWWSVFWDIFIARTNEKHSEAAAAYIEAQQNKAKEQQQMQIQQLQLMRQAQLQRAGPNTPSLSGPVNAIGSEGMLGQPNASALAAKMYEERMKHPNPMDSETSQPLLDARMALLKSASNHPGQLVQGNPGSVTAALQQIQARSQQNTDIKVEANLSAQRSLPMDPSSIYGQGIMQSKPGIGNAGLNPGVSGLPLKGWPLTGIDQIRPGLGAQVQRPLLHGATASQFQLLPQQQQQQLLAQVQAQGNLPNSPIYGDMDPRKFRGLGRGTLQGKDGQANANDGSIGSPMQSTSSKMNVPQMQQSSSQQQDPLQLQQAQQNNRKRKGPSSSGPANSTGTGNTIGPSNSQPSTPSTHTPGDGIANASNLQHVSSMPKNLMMYSADGTGALASSTNQLEEIDHFGDVGSLDENVESFLSPDDGDGGNLFGTLKRNPSDNAEASKCFSFNEVSSMCKSNGKVVCCHFSTDGKLLASAGHDKKVFIWNMETLQTECTSEFAPLLTSSSKSDVARSDFNPYLSSIAEHYNRFEDIRNHASKEQTLDLETVGQGEALVACLREVPSLYFKEDFALEDGPTFRAACPFTSVSENLVLQEKLSHYLDVVELHLVKEISLRSNSFFEAQGQLQDLNVKIVEGCSRIRELKETIRLLDKDLVESARNIQDLNCSRSNLLALQQKLRLILYVNQALSALKLLVASADCAGALDVTDDLQNLLDGDELTGLHCFRHLRDHVAASIDSVNSILSAEFMRAAIHDAGDTDVVILSKTKARASASMNGNDNDVMLDEEETSNFRDCLLPIVIGLLRTAKLPSVLRMYRDTLTADMKTAIKTAVAELLPILIVRPMESDFTPGEQTVDGDGGGLSLASKLRGLSSESFVQLLGAIFRIVQAHLVRAAEVKKAIEWIMSNLDGHFAADSVAAAIAVGAAAAENTQESDRQVGSTFLLPSQRSAIKLSSQGKANDASSPSNMSRNFRADVLRENAEAVFAGCDAAHGRWAKLLGVRALLHPKLRLQEFLSIYNITQDFIAATEKIGGRLGYSIRGTLQSQAKAFVDFQHEMRMTKIKAVLDQETWVEVDVPDEFQAITASLFTSEAVISGDLHDAKSNLILSYGETVTSNDVSLVDGTEAPNSQLVRTDSVEISMQNDGQVKPTSPESTESNKTSTSSSLVTNSDNTKERGKSVSQALLCGGVSYHMVNCGLILLKMLSEYIDMNSFLPVLSSEIVHRVVELLKFFNTRTAQLVLGAGAMQVSGLKSITAKCLALASQVISFTYAIIPEIRRILFLKVPETRKMLLMSEIDRVAQDYRVHRDEIHTKLVQIMRERVLHNLRGLPQMVEGWNRPEDANSQPSQIARSIFKEVGLLQRVVSRTLHEADAQAILRQVVVILHSQISEAYSRIDIRTPQAKERLHRDVVHILGCIRSLPTDNSGSDTPNWGQLDEFLVQKFGTEAG